MEDEGIKRELCGRGTKWTPSDLELLQKLIDDGLNLEEIVIQMEDETGVKRSQNSIKTITQKDRKSTRLNSSHSAKSRMPSSA